MREVVSIKEQGEGLYHITLTADAGYDVSYPDQTREQVRVLMEAVFSPAEWEVL